MSTPPGPPPGRVGEIFPICSNIFMFLFYLKYFQPNLAATQSLSLVECRDIWVSQYRDCWQLDWVQVSRLWLTGDHRPMRSEIEIGQSEVCISFYQLNPAKYWKHWKQKPCPMSSVVFDILVWIVYNAPVWQLFVWRFPKYLELKNVMFLKLFYEIRPIFLTIGHKQKIKI